MLIHFGRGEWIVVDSCVDREGNAAALSYLKLIGVDAARSVKTIVVTHWHDDRPMESKTAVPAPTPNHLSVALLVQLAGTAVLLGGDVLRFRADRKRGWLRIADLRREFDHPVSDVVKVPHHGSIGADAPEMWDHLLRERPVAALTPFRQGGVSLPKAGDVRRICARTTEAYITSLPRHGRPPKRTSAVEKTIEGFLCNRRLQSPPLGRVTLRCSSREGSRWTAQLAAAACRLHPGIL